jgi:hypothetical protein
MRWQLEQDQEGILKFCEGARFYKNISLMAFAETEGTYRIALLT